MSEEVVGSFPYEEWAADVQNALLGRGVHAEVSYAGPRAYPVVIDEADSQEAQEVLSEIGYLTCPSGRGPAMMGVLDWMPEEGVDQDALRDDLASAVEDEIKRQANISAAMAWSTPNDDEVEDGVHVFADFDGFMALDGDLVESVPPMPAGYVRSGRGGSVPSVEEEVHMEHVLRAVAEKEEFNKYPSQIVSRLLGEIWWNDYKNKGQVYWSVSGETEFWEKEKDESAE